MWSRPSLERLYGCVDVVPGPGTESGTGLRVVYFGTSSVLIRDGRTSLLVDGFFSRPALRRVLFGRIGPDRELIEACLARAGVASLDAVLCAHSHYDHALDAPVIARKFDVPLVGSQSTANVGRGYGLPARLLHIAGDGETLTFGDFEVTFVTGLHSPGDRAPGTIDTAVVPPARARAWKTGAAYSLFFRHPLGTLLVHASANWAPGRLDGYHADAVYLGIGQLGVREEEFRRRYWQEVVRATGARTVYPVHWDDMVTPLLTHPLR
ncbi:MBL fold metallo-hydrolase, partial [Streptomyces sp. GC420]|uniref:MBL fold metallo-hydrolase n=1 Tax=Streptomyces sp. GC420 TaxID=2697568 RepID=UPI001AA0B348